MPQDKTTNYKRKKNNNYRGKLQLGDQTYFGYFNEHQKVVEALRYTTKEALTPYYSFLEESIKAENQKGSYEIKWRQIESNFNLSITPIYSKFKIEKPKTIFKIFIEDMKILEETRNKLVFDKQDKIIRFDKSEIEIEDSWIYFNSDALPLKDETIEINNIQAEYKLTDLKISKNDKLKSNFKGKNETFDIEEITPLDNGWDIKIKTNKKIDKKIEEFKINSKILKATKYQNSFDKLFDENVEFKFDKVGNTYQCETEPNSKILKDEHNLDYTWKVQDNKNKNDIAIQLIDNDSSEDKSISEYFLQETTREVYQGKDARNTFKIDKKNTNDKILILRQYRKYPKQLKDDELIKIKVDTGNLKKQQDSIKLLNNSPVKQQQNLIKLFEKKDSRLWKTSNIQNINDWYILDNDTYDGTLDQRKFVKKAIATNDFAILEGPPGSGKTTTIIELILQLTKQGKKILLSASTHVAIDNVLERIDKYDKDKTVEPLRIGRIDSVGESIKHLQIDAKIETYKQNGFDEDMAKKIVLDGANLVCGTTMGINQFPPIRDRVTHNNGKRRDTDLPMDTIFDYMIIDESSKTTFQEFLVPAMLAKKWILVGDIKQLSPFIEQSHIVHNLDVVVSKDTQKAIRIVFETLYKKANPNPYIVEVSQNEENEIKKYLDSWSNKQDNPYSNKVVTYSDEEDLFKKLGSDLILIEEGSFESAKKYLPKTHIVILKNDNHNDNNNFWFKQNYLNHKKQLQRFNKIDNQESKDNNPLEYKEFFNDIFTKQNWAEAITWRMIRVYERRMLKNPNSYYEETYELLKPIEKNNEVDRIYNMTLPSILESIQVGNGESHKNNTTITNGFDAKDLEQRHETLATQHRMHKDISKFSREEFYTIKKRENKTTALKDASTIDRNWDYKKYNNRAVWLNASKSTNDTKSKCGRHFKEVKIIIDEIKKFLKFVESEPKNKENEPWSIAVLTFHKSQEHILRDGLKELCKQRNKMSRFSKDDVDILLYTVDKFQGMEADIVFISMAKYEKIGFLDNINRLNVALTRAKYQRVIVGDQGFFKNQKGSPDLKKLAEQGGM